MVQYVRAKCLECENVVILIDDVFKEECPACGNIVPLRTISTL